VLNQESAQHFLADVCSLLEWQIPAFAKKVRRTCPSRLVARGPASISRHRRGDPPSPQDSQRRPAPRYRSMRVVAIGGGHGTAVSLRALRQMTHEVTASSRSPTTVVRLGDCGHAERGRGGDLRICLGALADPTNPLTESFEHRFHVGELEGTPWQPPARRTHRRDGQPRESVRAVAQVMGVTGTIVPASCEAWNSSPRPKRGDAGTDRGRPSDADQEHQRERGTRPHPWRRSRQLRTPTSCLLDQVTLHERARACVVPGITQATAGTRRARSTSPTCTPKCPKPKVLPFKITLTPVASRGRAR